MKHHFDYAAEGELFCAQTISRFSRVTYKRFGSAAEAIRFVMEDMPASSIRSATLEVSERRLRADEIRALYESAAYPLRRALVS